MLVRSLLPLKSQYRAAAASQAPQGTDLSPLDEAVRRMMLGK